MYKVDVGAVDTRRFETMKEITRLEHRSVERFAVERHQRPGTAQIVGDDIEHGALARKIGHQVLLGDEAASLVEPATTDEKRMGARAAVETCCLEIEEDERHFRG